MRENYSEYHERDGYRVVTWSLMYHVKLNESETGKNSKFRMIAWHSLNKVEKDQVIHSWKKADVQVMENEHGPVDTIAVMFETKKNNQDGFIVVYIDRNTHKITGTETFY